MYLFKPLQKGYLQNSDSMLISCIVKFLYLLAILWIARFACTMLRSTSLQALLLVGVLGIAACQTSPSGMVLARTRLRSGHWCFDPTRRNSERATPCVSRPGPFGSEAIPCRRLRSFTSLRVG